MSVPPEIDDRQRSALMFAYTYSKLSGTSGEPVDSIVRSRDRSCVSFGLRSSLRSESMYFAEVPKIVMPSSCAKSNSTLPFG